MHDRPPIHDTGLRFFESMCQGFVSADAVSAGCELVSPNEIPSPCHALLVHTDHMTTTLHRHHGRPVRLQVVQECTQGDVYARKILLTLGQPGAVVEFGIARVDLRYVPASVRAGILSRNVPLGDLLIEHDVLRRIEPKWYLRFASDHPMLADCCPRWTGPAFGRLGIIYCDYQPAIELLEVVPQSSTPEILTDST